DGPSLSLLIDYYTNLGAYIGTEMSLPGTGIFGTTNISMGIGLTRTLARHGGSYTPILPDTDEVDWNWSMLFGMRVPFRYRFVADGSLRGRFGSLTWTIPHHSDPYMERDFMHRLTNMDWLNMIQQGGVDGMDVGGGTRLSSYTWNFNLAVIQPNLPGLRPYIQSITIGNISSSLQFRSFTAAGWTGIQASSPMRFFFAPEVATLYNTRVTVTGTPLRLGGGGAGQIGGAAAVPVTPEPVNPLEGIGVPISPFAVGEDDEPPPPRDPADTLVPPVLAQRFDLPRVAARNTTFTLDYNLSPTSASTLRFDGGDWREFDDVDWGDVRSVLTNVVTSGHIGTNFRFHDNFLTNTFRLGGTATWQQYTYLNEEATDFVVGGTPDSGRIDAARLQRYEGTNFTTTYNLSTDLRPFHRHPVFGASSLRHTMAGFAIGNEFAGTVDNPEWNMRFGQWSRERNGITGHSLGATVSARVMDMTQSITFAANLAPLIPRYSVNGNFNVWRTTTTASWAIRFPDDADPVHEPFNLNHTIRFGTFGNFNQVFQMDTDNVELTRLTSTLNLTRWRLTLTYRAGYIPGFEFDTVRQDWVARPEDQRQLRSEAFVVNFGRGIERRPQNAMINTFSANFNTATTFNLQRYTDSNFTFNISTTLNARLLNLTLTASSINNQIFRYFKNWPMFNDVQIAGMPDGRMNNPFLDLLDSFRFDNVDLRRRSGFKIQHFTLTAERALGDWNATLTLRMAPARATGANWEIRNRVDFVVRWIPITEFRSEISYDQTRDQRWIVEGL
ncbi:MAG: hypothetical protein FWD88_06675, partial [Treponema sp.]|nr:hypothetical protein [Treponema sp.]